MRKGKGIRMGKLPIAMQVFSVREEAEADFAGTMKQISEMGYAGVELAGLYGMEASTIRQILDEVSLKAISAHVPIEQLMQDAESTLKTYAAIGCEYVAIPYLTEEMRYGGSAYQEVLAVIPKIAAMCKELGMILLYHNHDFEFKKTEAGEYILDALYREMSADVLQTELDTCWVNVAGVDPVDYIKQYKNRCPLVHLKDFERTQEGVVLRALGEGVQDIPQIVTTAEVCGAKWLIIEQDEHSQGTPLDNMKKSLKYMEDMTV